MSNTIESFYTGEHKEYEFRFANTNITGWEIWFVVKKDETDLDNAAAIRISSVAGDNPNDDPVNGLMYVTASSTATDVTADSYHYAFVRHIRGTNPPDVRVLKDGKVKIRQNLNRAVV
jgi:hypothetical protein